MIELVNVTKTFDSKPLLKNLSLKIEQGEKVSIIGPGGCGKTTLLKLMLGLETPDSGDVFLLGKNLATCSSKEKQRLLRSVGVSFQQGALFDSMSVEENIRFAIDNMTDYSEAKARSKIEELLLAVKMPHTAKLYPHELSGGMKRRIGIVRAMANEPRLGIFDEPSSGLDPVTSTIILNMIKDLASLHEDSTMLVASSSVEIAIRFADRLIVINEGLIVSDDSWKQLLTEGPDWVQHFLSTRLVGLDLSYARELQLPEKFVKTHWQL